MCFIPSFQYNIIEHDITYNFQNLYSFQFCSESSFILISLWLFCDTFSMRSLNQYFVQNFMVNRLEKSSTVSNESWPGYQQNIDINNFYRPSIIFQNLKKVTFFYWSQWRYFKGMFKKVVLIEKISEQSSITEKKSCPSRVEQSADIHGFYRLPT